MNKDLLNFLNMVSDKTSAGNPDKYVASRKINDNDLSLVLGYLNGGSYISGIAFDKLIRIRSNIHYCNGGFFTGIDAMESNLPLTLPNLINFFETGRFLEGTYFGSYSQRATPRSKDDVNWNVWAKVKGELDVLQGLKIAPQQLCDVAQILYTEEVGLNKDHDPDDFREELKDVLIFVEMEVDKYRKELIEHKQAVLKGPNLRPVEDMHWSLWEVILMEYDILVRLKLASESLIQTVEYINRKTKEFNEFTLHLRTSACIVEQEISKFDKEIKAHIDEESKNRHQA
jgi:hypothetical protein